MTVTATNPYGVAGATSAAVGAVVSGAPANTSRPVINGTPRRGQVLTVSSAWDPAGTSTTYQWQRSADGATWTTVGTGASYTLTTAERDARVRVTVTAANAYGQASATSEEIGPVVWDPPVSTSAPAITGTTQRSFTLTAAAGSWDGAGNTYKYQWQRDDGGGWAPIGGAIGAVYTLAKADEGARVRVLVTATNPDGSVDRASDATAAPVSPFPPANVDPPVIAGTPQRSRTLSATRGSWTGPDNTYGYQWQRDFGEGYVDIAGARAPTYTLTVADVDATVRVVVTATNPARDDRGGERADDARADRRAGRPDATDRHRHRPARSDALRLAGVLERARQQHELSVAVLDGGGTWRRSRATGSTLHDRRRRRRQRPAPAGHGDQRRRQRCRPPASRAPG